MTTEEKPDEQPDKVLDIRTQFCPTPVIRAFQEMATMAPGRVLEILAPYPAREADFRAWAEWAGHEVVSADSRSGTLRLLVRKAWRTA